MNWERFYRLALTWVPDENEARELFMRAKNESDLLRLANRWRAEQGLDPAAPWGDDMLAEPLNASEHAEGEALWRRRQLRHRIRMVGVAAAVVLVLCATTIGALTYGQTLVNPPDPVYGQAPVAVAGAETRFVVYQVQRTSGSIRVWWALEGKGATADKVELPILVIEHESAAGDSSTREHQPWRSEQRTVGRRLLGYSTYHVAGAPGDLKLTWAKEPVSDAAPEVQEVDGAEGDELQQNSNLLEVVIPSRYITYELLVPYMEATGTVTLDSGTTTIGISQVLVTADYMAVRLDVKSGYRPVAMRRWLAVVDDESMFSQAYGEELDNARGIQTLYFPPPAEGAERVSLATARTELWSVPVEAPYISRLVQTETGLLLHMRGMEAFYEPGQARLELQSGQQVAVTGHPISQSEYAFFSAYRVPPSYAHQLRLERILPGLARVDMQLAPSQ